MTPRYLDEIGVSYRLVIEQQQFDAYAHWFDPKKLVVLDPAYQERYDAWDDLGMTVSKGSGPARNFIWDLAISEGAAWHWIMDDNIYAFHRLHQNQRIPYGDATPLHAMEEFALRYRNVAMVGPNYFMFAPSRAKQPAYKTGTRIYSCNLIRNDTPFRWRGRYNEDVDLSLRMLKAGWNTVLFNAFLQEKMVTQKMGGGNTEAFYAAHGTLPKSRMLVEMHPDVARVVFKFHRWHHEVDYSQFRNRPLIPDPDYVPSGVRYDNLVMTERVAWHAPGDRHGSSVNPKLPPKN